MDREKVLNALRCHANCDRGFDCGDCAYIGNGDCLDLLAMDAYALLKEQEAKTGEWIPVTNGRGGMECSICHDYAPSYQNGTEYLSKYCPYCGAKMEGR